MLLSSIMLIISFKFCREYGIPYLGLCLGMQIMVIEFAKNVLGLRDANSTEFDLETSNPVIDIIESQKGCMHCHKKK